MLRITVKRVYDPIDEDDGVRVLVDRVWPRGVSKKDLRADQWLRDVAPSDSLRKWFDHDPAKWEEFKLRYATELEGKPAILRCLLDLANEKRLVLLFSARDLRFNQAVALQDYLLSLDDETEGENHASD
jgi:uncharacterized protein YeaO (DUF488 family)